jgi:hypothetical protein
VMLQIIKCSLVCLPPCEIFLSRSLGNLVEGPCNMGESQHEPMIEVDKPQESLNLSKCGQHWPVTNDLDLSWIHIYTMLINNVAQILDPVHAKGAFFQVCI